MFIYSDLNQSNPTLSPLLFDIQCIYQSLFNILNTKIGERLFNPTFGISLEDQLFELEDSITETAILQGIITAVNDFENRVIIDTQETTITLIPGKNQVELVLVFSIVGVQGQLFTLSGTLS